MLDYYFSGLFMRPIAISFLAYCSVYILFIILNNHNIPYAWARRYLALVAILFLFWKIDEMMLQNLFPISSWQTRLLWYLQYIPTHFIPNATLLAVLHAGTRYHEGIPRGWYLTLPISGALSVAVLTNDTHQLAFSFHAGVSAGLAHFHFEILYWVSMFWVFLLFGIAIASIYKRIRVHALYRNTWIFLLSLGAGIIYLIWFSKVNSNLYQYGSFIGDIEIWAVILLLSLEASMRMGLIRSNFNYQEFFEASTLSAQLEDSSGIRYQTANLIPSTPQQRERAMTHEVYLDDDHRLHGREIPGGRMFWVEDLGEINRLAHELAELRRALEQENDLIKAENDMIERAVKAEEQNRLYSVLAQRVQPQLDKIEEILDSTSPEDPALREKLARACIYKAYVKRLSNMELIAQESHTLNLFELQSSLRETLDYLNINPGMRGVAKVEGSGFFDARALMLLYELTQKVIEDTVDELQDLNVRVTASDGSLSMTLTAKGPDIALSDEDYQEFRREIMQGNGMLLIEQGDDEIRVRVENFQGGGELA